MKKIFFIFAALSILLSACGATPAEETPPPLSVEDIQATALSMAQTMAAETIAAMPTQTFTPLPPTATFTPSFTPTPLYSPTPIFSPTPLATATSSNEIKMLGDWSGKGTLIKIVNNTKGTVTVSLYLNEDSNARGYYGYIPVPVLSKNQSAKVEVPKQGYYAIWAWIADGSTKCSASGGMGTNNSDKHEFHINGCGSIKAIGP